MFVKAGKAPTGKIVELGEIKKTDTVEHLKLASDINWKKPKVTDEELEQKEND